MWKIVKWELIRFFKSKLTYAIIIGLCLITVGVGTKLQGISSKDNFNKELPYLNDDIDIAEGEINYYEKLKGTRPLEETEEKILDDLKFKFKNREERRQAIFNKDNRAILKNEIDYLTYYLNDVTPRNLEINEESKYAYDIDKIRLMKYEYMYENNIILPYQESYFPSGLNLLLILSKKIYIFLLPLLYLLFSSMSLSEEFESKTYKILFSHPIKKSKVLIAKFLKCFIISSIIIIVATLIPIIVGTLLTEFGDVNYPVPVFKNTLFTAVMEKFIIDYTSMKPIFGVLIEITIINFIIALFFNGIGIFTSSLFKNKVAPLIFLMFSFLGIYFFPKIFHLKDIINPVVYGNAYEWVTGIKTLNNPKMTMSLYILVMITLTILFIILTNIRIKKVNLTD